MTDILLLSAYDAASHRYWREGLGSFLEAQLAGCEVNQIALPARYFSWRSRGNSLSFARHPVLERTFDLVIATSMTDLSALRGMSTSLASVPVIVYFHENQFAYPDTHVQGLLERQLTSIYTALSGNWLFFNSGYNRTTFLEGAAKLLRRMPDAVPDGVVDEIRQKSSVLPVALDNITNDASVSALTGGPLRIAWNHRWENDKGPDELQEIVEKLLAQGIEFEMSLFGQSFRQVPAAIDETIRLLDSAGRLAHQGYLENRADYLESLASHDVVLSTARHEFQGLAVQEAMLRGCQPVVPDALCYPEYIPSACRYADIDQAVSLLVKAADSRAQVPWDLSAYQWNKVGPGWLERVAGLIRLR